MKINEYRKLAVDGETIPTGYVYKIVNQLFTHGVRHPEDVDLIVFRTWQSNSKDLNEFPIYASVARRYGISDVKRRGDTWFENKKKIIKNGEILEP